MYLDDQTSNPEWVTAKTGLFGGARASSRSPRRTCLATTSSCRSTRTRSRTHRRVSDSDGHLSRDQEAELYRYYGLDYGGPASDSGLAQGNGDGQGAGDTVGHDTSGPTTDSAMTRSEEELRVGTQDQEAGRVRLRKYVETEHVTQTVPVRKERAVLEREPIEASNLDDATSGPAISEEEHEVVLHEERPVVEKTAVPVERVKLDTSVDVEEHEVSEDVRKEQIEVDGDIDDTRR